MTVPHRVIVLSADEWAHVSRRVPCPYCGSDRHPCCPDCSRHPFAGTWLPVPGPWTPGPVAFVVDPVGEDAHCEDVCMESCLGPCQGLPAEQRQAIVGTADATETLPVVPSADMKLGWTSGIAPQVRLYADGDVRLWPADRGAALSIAYEAWAANLQPGQTAVHVTDVRVLAEPVSDFDHRITSGAITADRLLRVSTGDEVTW